MEKKQKHARQKQIKEIEEIETAYMMAQVPKSKQLPDFYGKSDDINASRLRQGEYRTFDQFISDQEAFE
jgi:hypothetical protein